MDTDKKEYIEHFFKVTFQGEAFTFEEVEEIDYPDCAEVNIPYHTDTEIHNYTCYITNLRNDTPAIPHMFILDDYVKKHGGMR